MTINRRWRYALIGVGVLVIVGVAIWSLGLAPANGAAAGLEGRTWKLTAINGQPAVPGSSATISFAGGKVAGSTGVNQFGGGYRASATSITLSDIAATMMASADPALNAQEQALLPMLQGQLAYHLSGNQLVLSSPSGTLTFSA